MYAIEEPETSQHPTNQHMLLDALAELSKREDCQVILSTHVPGLAMFLPVESLRYVAADDQGVHYIQEGDEEIYETISRELGVVPDNRVRVLVCVEGPNDVTFLSHASRILRQADSSLPDLQNDPRVVLLPLGGENLKQWVERKYLSEFGRPEVHIYDRGDDAVCKYQDQHDQVNARNDGSCAFITNKREIENYLHACAISDALAISVEVSDTANVPLTVAQATLEAAPDAGQSWSTLDSDKQRKKISRAKQRLNEKAVQHMTLQRFSEIDSQGEIQSWLHAIGALLE